MKLHINDMMLNDLLLLKYRVSKALNDRQIDEDRQVALEKLMSKVDKAIMQDEEGGIGLC